MNLHEMQRRERLGIVLIRSVLAQLTGYEDYVLWDEDPIVKHENICRALIAVSVEVHSPNGLMPTLYLPSKHM